MEVFNRVLFGLESCGKLRSDALSVSAQEQISDLPDAQELRRSASFYLEQKLL